MRSRRSSLNETPAQQRLARDVLAEVGCDEDGHVAPMVRGRDAAEPPAPSLSFAPACGACTRHPRHDRSSLCSCSSPAALAAPDGGQGTYGEADDKVVTNAGFIVIAFFPLFILAASLLQWRLDKRKDARKAAAKRRAVERALVRRLVAPAWHPSAALAVTRYARRRYRRAPIRRRV